MSVAKLNLIEIEFPLTQNDLVLTKLTKLTDFHPEPAKKVADTVHGLEVLSSENPYPDLINKINEYQEKYNFKINTKDVQNSNLDVGQAKNLLKEIDEQIAQIDVVKSEVKSVIEENRVGVKQIENLRNSPIDFDQLFSTKYLKIRFGFYPKQYKKQLEHYHREVFLYEEIYQDNENIYCLYVTTKLHAPEIDNIFSSYHFTRTAIPRYIHGNAEEAYQLIEEENKLCENSLKNLDIKLETIFADYEVGLNQIYHDATRLNEIYDVEKYVVTFASTGTIYGFTEKKDSETIKKDFESIKGVTVTIKDANDDTRLTPPTKLHNNWFTQPFGMFVELYGVPSYTDFDPTTFVAISYTLLFGIMFGDVGQGIVLSIVGYLAWKLKGMKLGAVGMRLGISSAIFGCLFGSVFGNEEIIKATFAPMDSENVLTLLIGAVSIGVCLMIISMIINVIMNFKKKNLGEALFSQNGIAGIIFFASVIAIVGNMIVGLNLPFVGTTLYYIIFIGLPALAMLFKEPLTLKLEGKEKMFPDGVGNFLTQSIFEMVDILLTFVSNTMSFMRVGGFVLSHAGMMLVVYILAGMFSGVGYYIVLVFGNIFVMCLEGLIVGIQVLRLEFYEMFSRYYSGNGKRFVSINEN